MHWMGSFSTLLESKTKKYSNLNWAAPSWLTLRWQCRRRRRHGSRSRGLNENKNIAIWLLSYLLLKMINSELEFAKYFVSTRSFDQIFITKLIFIQLITWIQTNWLSNLSLLEHIIDDLKMWKYPKKLAFTSQGDRHKNFNIQGIQTVHESGQWLTT